MPLSCYWQSSLQIYLAIASWIHSYFDNIMTKFMINDRTDMHEKLMSICYFEYRFLSKLFSKWDSLFFLCTFLNRDDLVRMSDPRSLGSWCIKRVDDSTLVEGSIGSFWCTMIEAILNHWSWPGSMNTPLTIPWKNWVFLKMVFCKDLLDKINKEIN